MFKLPKNIMLGIATLIIMFAICAPITGFLTGILIASQNVNYLLTILLDILGVVVVAVYLPIIVKGIAQLFKFLKY